MRSYKYLFMLIVITVLWMNHTIAQKSKNSKLAVLFYNVENFFDIEDDPDVDDDKYLPDGDKRWTKKKYNKKIEDVVKVITSISPGTLPGIIGLCEVENKTILNDIVKSEELISADYNYIHENSPDDNGLDVALIYNPGYFGYISHKAIPLALDKFPEVKTRDILYVQGIVLKTDTLHIFINHWKSRSGKDDNKIRKETADILENEIDELLDKNKKSKILVIGDFNDEPTDNSVFNDLNANNKRKNTSKKELYNLFYDLHNVDNKGTYSKKGKWYMFDQMMVSQELIDTKEGIYVKYDAGQIFQSKWLMEFNPKIDDFVPKKTYGGNTYFGGVSNHLPIYIKLEIKK